MKTISYILILLTVSSCKGQVANIDDFNLSISPTVDITKDENLDVIKVVESFLMTKNNSLSENDYWIESDFNKYIYPYADIYKIERGNRSQNDYKPVLMELISIEDNRKLVKIGFVGYNAQTGESLIRAIYNIIAILNNGNWLLKRSIDHQTNDWNIQKENSITYILPPGKIGNKIEIEKQAKDITIICSFFECSPISITYYSCYNPKQVFEVKGFDYLPNMYFSQTGGMADYGNIIYSGNNSEYYTHEIVHIYTKNLFPNIQNFLDEGIATYIGGSGVNDYSWHREKMAEYIADAKIELAEHLNPYERFYINDATPIPYMVGALICERTNRLYGKKGLFELLDTGDDLWLKLNKFGLTKENLTEELRNELQLTTTPYMR